MARHDKRKAQAAESAGRAGPRVAPQEKKKKGGAWMGPSMARYFNERRLETNKTRRVVRHARRHPTDHQAMTWLKKHVSDSAFSGIVLKIGGEWLESMT
jgi:hypothetical protein